ncbi:hypothetical protein [Epilithonimonas caeni]|uniref:hypothetical protein n=1 Tax=Epilithonimonas caeni TaxID=365343 RepID=UPI000423C549|nr:hypothetical protein [Epilithonimonas caeni]
MDWKNLSKEKSICTQTGNWDGKKSDELIVRDYKGNYYIAVCYQGFIDGSEFCEFFDYNDFQIDGVIFWATIPEPF